MPSFGLNILPTDSLVQAILDVDTDIFTESIPMDVEKETDTRSLFYLTFFRLSQSVLSSFNVISTRRARYSIRRGYRNQ